MVLDGLANDRRDHATQIHRESRAEAVLGDGSCDLLDLEDRVNTNRESVLLQQLKQARQVLREYETSLQASAFYG